MLRKSTKDHSAKLNAVSAVLDQLNPDILKTSDGEALLKAAIGLGLEGVVSKKRGSPYRSGPCRDWVKVKSAIWREANRERWSLLQRQG